MSMLRSTIERRKRDEEQRQVEQQEREQQEAPLNAEIARMNTLQQERKELQSQTLMSLPLSDSELQNIKRTTKDNWFTDDATITARNELAARECAVAFLAEESRYEVCPDNFTRLVDFMGLNNIFPTKEGYHFAFETLMDAGLMKLKPEAVVVPAPIEPVAARKRVEVPATEEPNGQEPSGQEGIEPSTGKSRFYTNVEIEAMGAEEYRKSFSLRRLNNNQPSRSHV